MIELISLVKMIRKVADSPSESQKVSFLIIFLVFSMVLKYSMLTIGFAAVWDAYVSFINFYYAIHSEVNFALLCKKMNFRCFSNIIFQRRFGFSYCS